MRYTKETSSLTTSPTLLENLQREEKEAWVRLVSCYSPRLTAWCLSHGLDATTTQDILQETWISVGRSLRNFDSVPGHGAFRAWLHRILLRRIVDHRRRQNPLPTVSGGNSLFGKIPSEFANADSSQSGASSSSCNSALPVGRNELQRNWRQTIDSIRDSVNEQTWQVFARSAMEGVSTEEVAAEFSITPAYVRQIRSRILRKLRMAFSRSLANPPAGPLSAPPSES